MIGSSLFCTILHFVSVAILILSVLCFTVPYSSFSHHPPPHPLRNIFGHINKNGDKSLSSLAPSWNGISME